MFELASRLKLRFESPQGMLSVEDLWDIPLTAERSGRANLDDIARALHREVSDGEEISFVKKNKTTNDMTKTKFEVVKHVIDVRLEENEKASIARANREKKQQILELISRKESEQLAGQSLDELRQLAESL